VQSQFNFLGLFFGKAFFCLFLGLMCFNRHKWFSWACSILFFISTVFYLILGVTFRKEEKRKLQNIMTKNSSPSPSPNEKVRDVNIQQNQAKV
jgi:uncharacterized membrane protein